MSWVSFIAAILKFAMTVFLWARENKMVKAGEDKVIAATALTILQETEEGKAIRDHIEKLGDPEAAALWDRMLK